jgi:F-type H+-transporting ATPase subunit epsilon
VADPIRVEIVSPERVLYSGEATMVVTRTLEGGEIAFQAGHQAFLGALVENHTRVYQVDGTVQDVAIHRGFVEVHGDPTVVSILSDTAELAQDIDVERAKAAMERHVLTLKQEHDEEVLSAAISGKARAQARLAAANVSFTA